MTTPKNRTSLYLLSLFGTVAEYYDYALYGFCAALLAHYFFPDTNQSIALLKTYGLFALASMGRPVGSLIFGWMGDKFGRSYVLRRSMIGIAIPTTIIALTPDQETWGAVSALIILICRFLQGIFVSGEGDGVRIYIYESKIGRYPYIANAFVGLSMIIGALIASFGATFALNNATTWHWRLPFIFGGCLGLIVFALRQRFVEIPLKKIMDPQDKAPINWRGVIATVLLLGSLGGSYHLFFVFRPTFIAKLSSTVLAHQAQGSTTLALCFYMTFTLAAACLAERFGGRRVICGGAIGLIALSLIFSSEMLASYDNPWMLATFTLVLAMMSSPAFILIMRQFDPSVRFRCASIGHSIGSLLLSGSAPFLATFLWTTFSNSATLAAHLIFLAVLSLGALLLLRPAQQPS